MSTDTAIKVDPARTAAVTRAQWHRPLLGFTALAALLAIVAAVGMVVDDRMVTGSPVWFKPFKFAISFGLYSAALAWMLHLSQRARRLGWWTGTIVAVASTAEVGAIVLQAVRGRASHFNVATSFDQAVFSFMGATVMVIWLATFVLAVIASAQPLADRATTWAIRFGVGLSLVGMLLAVLMIRPTPEQQLADDSGAVLTTAGAHSVGVPDGGPSMAVTGWAITGGDLRIPHFFGIHALQALPLLALLLAALARRSPTGRLASAPARVRLVWIAAAGYSGTLALLTWQALRGQPLLRPDQLTLSVAGALAAAALLATAAVLTRRAPGMTATEAPKSTVGR